MGAVRRTCRRRVGPKCSPRSSCTPSASPSSPSSPSLLWRTFLGIVFVIVSIGAAGVCAVASTIRRPTRRATLTLLVLVLFALGIHARYGGEAAEVIRYMDMRFECGDEALGDEMAGWLDEVATEQRLIEELPVVVGRVSFHYDDDVTNLNKVFVTVGCCWSSSRLLRVYDNCDESGEKPSHLEALRGLRAKITEKHMCAGHQHHPKAAARAAHLAGQATGNDVEPANAFDALRLRGARLVLAQRAAKRDAEAAAKARAEEAAATCAREAAEAAAAASKAAAEALQAALPTHKRQRRAFEAGPSVCACRSARALRAACRARSTCTSREHAPPAMAALGLPCFGMHGSARTCPLTHGMCTCIGRRAAQQRRRSRRRPSSLRGGWNGHWIGGGNTRPRTTTVALCPSSRSSARSRAV